VRVWDSARAWEWLRFAHIAGWFVIRAKDEVEHPHCGLNPVQDLGLPGSGVYVPEDEE
jgi:hypothetical protein